VIFLAKNFSSGILGQYAMANTVIALPSALLGNAVGNAYYQRAAESWSQGHSFRDLWLSTARRLLLIGIPSYSCAILILPWLVPAMFGTQWRQAGEFSAILSVSSFFAFAATPMDGTCMVVGAWWYIPSWHGLRFVSTALVAWASLHWDMKITSFIWLLVIQQSIIFLIDFIFQWLFCCRRPSVES
jgi:O-antigen/teichoic acid export membrane protein